MRPNPLSPIGPGLGDQFNPFGWRGYTGQRDYTEWFNVEYPKSVGGARDLMRGRIKDWISKHCDERPTETPGGKNGSDVQDVDISPNMKRFGDTPQSWWRRNVEIGFFEFRTDPANVRWLGNQQFCFDTTMYVEEQTGTDSRIGGLFLFNKRIVRMGEWALKGCGRCQCNKYAH